jgi:hypothetical protein
VTFGAAIAACFGASSLPAQTQADLKEPRVWSLHGLRTGYCVRFLVEPRTAVRELRPGFLLLSAAQDQSIHPALRQAIQNQPEFASWAPSSLCFYFMDTVQLGKRRLVEKNPRKYQMIGVWTLAAVEQAGGARRDLVLDMYANRTNLMKAAEAAQVRLHEAHLVVSDQADTTADIYSVKLGKSLLVWNGHPAGDSSRVEHPIQESWVVPGLRTGMTPAQLTFAPIWSRPVAGSFRVEGKGGLANALKASPIRFVGPFYRGGGGELRFFR